MLSVETLLDREELMAVMVYGGRFLILVGCGLLVLRLPKLLIKWLMYMSIFSTVCLECLYTYAASTVMYQFVDCDSTSSAFYQQARHCSLL